MRRVVAGILGLLVVNTTLVQAAFACVPVRTSARGAVPTAPAQAMTPTLHHHTAPSGHRGAPAHSSRGAACGFMLACAAVSTPVRYVLNNATRITPAPSIETALSKPVAPATAPETPPPRS